MSSIEGVLAGTDRWHVECCHVIDGLRKIRPKSIHCIVTSPPYWGLRDYQIPASVCGGKPRCRHIWGKNERGKRKDAMPPDNGSPPAAAISDGGRFCTKCDAWLGCFGNEPTLELYIAHSVEILAECHRVLRDDGQLWWNLGDSYSREDKYGGQTGGNHGAYLPMDARMRAKRKSGQPNLSKLLIPHRVALAAAAAGWIVRQDIVWQKVSPMPESVQSVRWIVCRHQLPGRDADGKATWRLCDGCERCTEFEGRRVRLQRGAWRCTTAHEFIFQLVKGDGYFGDAEGVKERAVGDRPGNRVSGKLADVTGDNGKAARLSAHRVNWSPVTFRNPRSVWALSHEPLKEKHFAAFPSFIPRRIIQASTSQNGVCSACGANYAPIVEKIRVPTRSGKRSKVHFQHKEGDPYAEQRGDVVGNRDPRRHQSETRVVGYLPTCDCGKSEPLPAIVMDIFSGSGTSGRVAYSLGRRFIGLEIAERYAELSRERIVKPFTKRKPLPKHKRPMDGQKPLFE